jgi:putative ABC transport system permease protein
MFKNYINIAVRNIMKQKMYSLITMAGLAIGFGVFIFFFRFFIWALSADRFHRDSDRIHVIVQVFESSSEGERHTAFIPHPLIPILENNIPEIEESTRFFEPGRMVVKREGNLFYENGVMFVDPNFLSFFTFRSLIGDPETMLSQPNTVVMTRSMAEKYFGDESPIGKVLTLNNRVDVTVTGIVEGEFDIQSKTSIIFDLLVSMETTQALFGSNEDWSVHNRTGFVRITHGVTAEQLEEKCNDVLHRYFPNSPDAPKRMYLFPIEDISYRASHIYKFCGHESFTAYVFFLIIGTLFLLIVSINFVNLSTAKYSGRTKEVGLRKVVGAQRSQLIVQFLGESVIMTITAIPLAFLVYDLACSLFFARIGFTADLSLFKHGLTLLVLFAISLATGLVAGFYPAFFLSSFSPAHVLKSKLPSSRVRGQLRKILVILQFTISTIIIVFAITWKRQADFVYRVYLGYHREGILVLPLSQEVRDNLNLLKERVKQHPYVTSVSASVGLPARWRTKGQVVPEGMTETDALSMYTYGIDYDFFDVLDIPLISGRTLSQEYDDEHNYIINRMMAQRMEWENPVGKMLTVGEEKGTVVGMVHDFHFDNLFFPMAPAVLKLEQEHLNYLLVEMMYDEDGEQVSAFIETQWKAIFPNVPFEYFTLDDYFERRHFSGSVLVAEIIAIVGGISIFFACLGLLALASYSARQRTKEIGIRKVLGASIPDVLKILAKDFLKFVLLSNIVAVPFAYFITKGFLNFAYSQIISINIDIFLYALMITLLTAVSAVIPHTLKAACVNPVNSLRYE